MVRKKAKKILNVLELKNCEASIVLVNNEKIKTLNLKYRNKNKSTNVLSFPMQKGEFSFINPELLGDVVISIEKCIIGAGKKDISFEEEFNTLLVHGFLHLAGYDREKGGRQAAKMRLKTSELLAILKKG